VPRLVLPTLEDERVSATQNAVVSAQSAVSSVVSSAQSADVGADREATIRAEVFALGERGGEGVRNL
jgi:hypothetical protein